MKTLAYVPYGTGQVAPFNQVFTNSFAVDLHNLVKLKDADALIVWGGADISPTIYGEPVSEFTGADKGLSARDKFEVEACEAAIEYGVPIIGICRGAQLACAMAGGKLVQHVNNHGRDHWIETKDGRRIWSSSVHHQMMYPWDVEHEMIAWAADKRSDVYITGDNSELEHLHGESFVEPEVVYFPSIKALAIQGHPEFMAANSPFVDYCMELVNKFVLSSTVETTA